MGIPKIIEDREETVKRFKKGEIAYNETPVGICTSVAACDKRAMRAVSACISCDKAVIKPIQLKKVISAQKDLLEALDPKSMIYRMEKEQLQDLEKFETYIEGKK